MGRRIDDLKIDDRPHGDDDRQSEWFAFAVEIVDLLDSGDYEWASETLSGIQATVERTGRVSEAQRQAVTNIVAARDVGRQRWRGRGWRR